MILRPISFFFFFKFITSLYNISKKKKTLVRMIIYINLLSLKLIVE